MYRPFEAKAQIPRRYASIIRAVAMLDGVIYTSELSRSQTNRGSWIYISNLRIELDIKILTRRLKTQILNLKFSSVSFLLLVGQNKC